MTTTTLKDFARMFIRRPVTRPPPPVKTQAAAYSAIFSMYDEPHGPSRRLIDLSLAAVEQAMTASLANLGRDDEERKRLDCFPGEHYRFIAGLVRTLRPEVVVHMGPDNLTARVLQNETIPRRASCRTRRSPGSSGPTSPRPAVPTTAPD
jgi:hypothetical protein